MLYQCLYSCCCCSLVTGSYILGYSEIFIGILRAAYQIFMIEVLAVKFQSGLLSPCEHDMLLLKTIGESFGLIHAVIFAINGIVLALAMHRKNMRLIHAHVMIGYANFLTLFLTLLTDTDPNHYIEWSLVLTFVFLCFVCVNSLYESLRLEMIDPTPE